MKKLMIMLVALWPAAAGASLPIPLTVTMSEVVMVTGTPRVAVDVGGQTRYATYTSGSGTNALTFTLTPQAGDVDLDGITVSSPLDLNGGTLKDAAGNNAALTFTPPATSGIKVNYPSLGMDFTYDADGRYSVNGTIYNDPASFLAATGGTFSRTSTGTYFDSTGTLQIAAANTPRFDYDPTTHTPKGLLLEEARTNVLTRSEVTGVVAGTPGTLPTNWAWAQITPGFTMSVLGSGTENGLSYVDVRVAGTSTATNRPLLRFGTFTSTTSARYTISFWAKCLSATCPNFNAYAGGANGWGNDVASTPTQSLTSTLRRYEFYGTAVATGGTNAVPWIDFNAPFAIGETWDFSVRVAAPQTELGAFATSYIPTTGSAASRTRDVFNFPTSTWFNQTDGTWSAQFSPYPRVPASPRLVAASSTAGAFLNLALSTTTYRSEAFDGTSVGTATLVAPNVSSVAVGAYDATTKAVCAAGGAVVSLARSATYPLTPSTTIYVGAASVNNQTYSGHMEKIKYWPVRLSDSVLTTLSQ